MPAVASSPLPRVGTRSALTPGALVLPGVGPAGVCLRGRIRREEPGRDRRVHRTGHEHPAGNPGDPPSSARLAAQLEADRSAARTGPARTADSPAPATGSPAPADTRKSPPPVPSPAPSRGPRLHRRRTQPLQLRDRLALRHHQQPGQRRRERGIGPQARPAPSPRTAAARPPYAPPPPAGPAPGSSAATSLRG